MLPEVFTLYFNSSVHVGISFCAFVVYVHNFHLFSNKFQLITEELGLNLENVTIDMLGSCKKVMHFCSFSFQSCIVLILLSW